MRTIQVEDDVFAVLELTSMITKLPLPKILRLAVMPQEASVGAAGQASPVQIDHLQVSTRDKGLREYVQSPGFLANTRGVDQFLGILSFVSKQDPGRLKALLSMEGRKRRYFANTRQELENSGISVNAKKIPGTDLWAVTNNSTDNKKVLLRQALTLLGYDAETMRLVSDSLR